MTPKQLLDTHGGDPVPADDQYTEDADLFRSERLAIEYATFYGIKDGTPTWDKVVQAYANGFRRGQKEVK